MGNVESSNTTELESARHVAGLEPTYSSIGSVSIESPCNSPKQSVRRSTLDKRPGADFVDVNAMDTLTNEEMEKRFLEIVVSLPCLCVSEVCVYMLQFVGR